MGCRARRTSSALRRVVLGPGGDLVAGSGRPGRGAWVCPEPTCLALAARRGAWGRALRAPVPPAAAVGLAERLGLDAEGPGAPEEASPP